MKTSVHLFDPVIYPRKLFVVKGGTFSDIRSSFTSHDGSEISYDEQGDDYKAKTMYVKCREGDYFGVLVWLVDKAEVSTIAHESVHAANFVFGTLGISHTTSEDEHFAYLVGWIADCIDQVVKGKFKD